MRSLLEFVAASMVIAPATRADDSTAGIGVSVGLVGFQPHVGSATFDGSGTSRVTGEHEGFTHTGREVGATTPTEMGIELRLDYVDRYFGLGLGGFVADQVGGAATAADPSLSAVADGSSVSSLGFMVRALGRVPISDRVDLGFGPDLGIRVLSVPLPGFEKTTCHSKVTTYPCDETASTTQPYLEPRVSITFTTDPAGGATFFFLSGWARSCCPHRSRRGERIVTASSRNPRSPRRCRRS